MKNLKTKLIIKHALKRAICHIEFSSELRNELDQIEREYIKNFEGLITENSEYRSLLSKLSELVEIKIEKEWI